jgi:hypothetical protein
MMLMGTLGERVKTEETSLLRLYVDNSSEVHVENAIVSSSRPMMRELRRLKEVLDELRLELGLQYLVRVDTIRCKQICRRTVTSFVT